MSRTLSVLLLFASIVAQWSFAQDSPHGNIHIVCQACHTTDSWQMRRDASFNHSQTGFPLEGQHQTVDCVTCHTSLKFSGTNAKCTSCHTDIHKAELGNNCTRCHSMQSWKIADMIQKHQQTRFPLVGKHAAVDCQSCHTGFASNEYLGTPTTCIGCHRSDYTSTTNPNHGAAGFTTNCTQCHLVSSLTWQASFDHNLTTFPLTGAHRTVVCSSCHTSGSYKSVPTDCYSCHLAQFQSTTNPGHLLAGFPTTCATCHTTTAWQPASFDHASTKFPLTGAHTSTSCQSCHTNNNYQLLYSGCYSCHATNYNNTTNPVHSSAGFPTTCETCHSTTTWAGATFNHTWFPTSHGNAGGVCSSCHTNPSNYAVFQCTDCHGQSQTNSNHSGVSGYVYSSANCYSCHPNGRSG